MTSTHRLTYNFITEPHQPELSLSITEISGCTLTKVIPVFYAQNASHL